MNRLSPLQLILIGLGLLVVGLILPFLMVLRVLEPTLLLNFLAYFASLIGLVLGLVGIVTYSRLQRHDKE